MRHSFHSVIVATKGRSRVLEETLISIREQTVPPDEVIISAVEESDWPRAAYAFEGLKCIRGPLGLAAQRNAGIAALDPRAEAVTFLDDDVELARDYIEQAQRIFLTRHDIVLFSGHVLQNGGISRPAARDALGAGTRPSGKVKSCRTVYGANMNVRREVLEQVHFDERLVLYGWLEDFDFSQRCSHFGRIAKATDCWLVHLRVPESRDADVSIGISQVINPCYLWSKGAISLPEAVLRFWLRYLLRNSAGLLLQDSAVDRRARLKGNVLATRLVLSGRLEPERVADLGGAIERRT